MSLAQPAAAWRDDDGQIFVLPELTTKLEDGRTAYYQRDMFDCVRACVATLTQIPYEDVPEMPYFEDVLPTWATGHGFDLGYHHCNQHEMPDMLLMAASQPSSEEYSKGVTFGHVVVARGPKVIFNPNGFCSPDGTLTDRTVPTFLRAWSLQRKEST